MSIQPEEFNKLMHLLVGDKLVEQRGEHPWMVYEPEMDHLPLSDYYSDMNLLMPLAWKYGCYECLYEGDPKLEAHLEAIRQCLVKVAEEMK